MRWSIPIGRVLGIRLGIHITFFLLIAWIGWLGWAVGGAETSLWAIGMICLLFVCVILHELGHSVVALRFGVEVHSITLLPIGGVAGMKSMPEEPRKELLIAIAGPLVNVLILAVLIPLKGFPSWIDMPMVPTSMPEMVDTMIRANMILVVFNMIPAFPMDGGRVLRAVLAMMFSYTTATAWAAGAGRLVAVLFVVIGIYAPQPFLVLIGVFVFLGAEGEARMVRVKAALKNVPVSVIMRRDVPYVNRHDLLRTCLEAYHMRGCVDFVVRDGERLFGLLPAAVWMEALKQYGPDEAVDHHVVRRYVSFQPETPLDLIIEDVWGLKQDLFPVMHEGRLMGLLTVEDLRAFIGKRAGGASTLRPSPDTEEQADSEPRRSRFSVDLG